MSLMHTCDYVLNVEVEPVSYIGGLFCFVRSQVIKSPDSL